MHEPSREQADSKGLRELQVVQSGRSRKQKHREGEVARGEARAEGLTGSAQ